MCLERSLLNALFGAIFRLEKYMDRFWILFIIHTRNFVIETK